MSAAGYPTPQATRPTPRWGIALVILLAALLVLLLALTVAAATRPAEYRPASIDYNLLRVDKRDLARLLDEIGAGLNGGSPVRVLLNEQQTNRWLAARAEVWPDEVPDVAGFPETQVRFLDGRIRVLMLLERNPWSCVLTLDWQITLSDEQAVLACNAARIGVLPVPARWALAAAGSLLGNPAWSWTLAGGKLAHANEWRWPNGKQRFRLRGLQVQPGALAIELVPIPSWH